MSAYFYLPDYDPSQTCITLEEDTAKHVVQVLRMKPGSPLQLTDGKGHLLQAEIRAVHKKNCEVEVLSSRFTAPDAPVIQIGISLLKNAGRLEWFLEKAAEIGITEISLLTCDRTEKQQVRYERMRSILVSAMLQSQQVWLTRLPQPVSFDFFISSAESTLKFIAHCEEGQRTELAAALDRGAGTYTILIGPEGDFSPAEILRASDRQFIPVTLGSHRLRSETAGVVAATLLKLAGSTIFTK